MQCIGFNRCLDCGDNWLDVLGRDGEEQDLHEDPDGHVPLRFFRIFSKDYRVCQYYC